MVAFLRVVFGLECEEKKRETRLNYSRQSRRSRSSRVGPVVVGSVVVVVGSVVRSFSRIHPSMGKFELPLDFLRNDSSIDPPSKPPIDRSRPMIHSIERTHRAGATREYPRRSRTYLATKTARAVAVLESVNADIFPL